jgi:hypothetical protein
MGKEDLIKMIGRLFVEEEYRNRFINSPEEVINENRNLTDEEREYLRHMSCVIISWVKAACIKYDEKDDKRS